MPEQKTFDHVAFMRDPNEWPVWPVLPVKERGPDTEHRLGCLVEIGMAEPPNVRPVVYLTNMFDRNFDSCDRIEFDDFEALVEAGWVVD